MRPHPVEPLLRQALSSGEGNFTATDGLILDAALTMFASYGSPRTSVDDVAQSAGVSRRTVYRRFGSKDELVRAVALREIGRILSMIRDTAAAAHDPAEGVADIFVEIIRLSRRHPMIDRLVRREPQQLVEILRGGNPPAVDIIQNFVSDRLRSGQRKGALPARDTDQLADVLIRLALGYILVPSSVVDANDSGALRALALATVAPFLSATPSM